jgi:hypothetical protein
MNNIVIKHMESGGSAINCILGGVPNAALVINTAATSTEAAILLWLKDLDNEIQITAVGAFSYVTSNQITSYSGASIDAGTVDDDDDPVRVTGGEGITIGADFSDDGDEIIVIAFFTDRDVDDGDVG